MALSTEARRRLQAAITRRVEANEIADAIDAATPNEAAAAVSFSAGTNLVGVDGTGSNAAPLAGTETRLDALETAILAIISALQAADLMDT
jgi:hypothetical protein